MVKTGVAGLSTNKQKRGHTVMNEDVKCIIMETPSETSPPSADRYHESLMKANIEFAQRKERT